ncbi:MAG TPA: large conductance mechanosensitive channel protein MscL [Tepidisphaeraceae bacterium]|jgi:large conductance mechanosensitive channel
MFTKAVGVFKSNLNEFKEFAFKGNLIQLAIGVVLGGAFGKLITSFVDNLFLPVLSVFGADPKNQGAAGYANWSWRGIKFGAFLGDLISFLIIATAIFLLMVKVIGWIVKLSARTQSEEPAEATTKTCPYCMNTVPIKAVRCGFCTSDITETAAAPTPATT